MSKKDDKAGKDKKGKKGKNAAGERGLSVANHPRAKAHVRMAKGWGGIVGFAIAAYMAHKAQVPFAIAGLRALAAGVTGYVVAWGCAVTVWRHLMVAELRAAVEAGRVVQGAPASDGSAQAGS
jgi:hypothetical protein